VVFRGRGHIKRRRRERILIAGVLLLAIVSVGMAPRFADWITGRSRPRAGTIATVGEAMAIAEALGDHPNDDQLIKAIQDREFAGRRLAIEFLGEGGYGDALPVLDTIVRDSSEADRFRVAALEAIFRIAAHHGRSLALEFEQDRVLGGTALDILTGGEAIRSRPSRLEPLVKYVP
jgi:hypothetical protein